MYFAVFQWIFSFLFASFQNPLPWQTDDVSSWNRSYFPEVMLEKTDSLNERGRFIPKFVAFELLAAGIIFFFMRKGLQSSSEAM
mmetsp:Transcript_38854/g.59060  ORF Transcript_38854/g.59060 Transcript_38854/m.59060 type:complete len:84 (+) Transcript_38854:104-355(+)